MKYSLQIVPHLLMLILLCSCSRLQGTTESATPPTAVLAESFFFGCAYLDSNRNGTIESDDQGLEGARFVVALSRDREFAALTPEDGCATVVIPGGLGEDSWPVATRMEAPTETSLELADPAVVVLAYPESHADFLFTELQKTSLDEPSETAAATTADGSPQPATPSPKIEREDAVEDLSMSLVQADLQEREEYGGPFTIKIRREPSVVSLPGLSLYVATPQVPDAEDIHCAVYGEAVWYSEEALHNIVMQFSLGANPAQLSDETWLAMVAFFTYTEPLEGPDDLKLIDSYIPESELAKIESPSVNRLEAGGIELAFYYETVSYMLYPEGPMALWAVKLMVTNDNQITLQHRAEWLNPEAGG